MITIISPAKNMKLHPEGTPPVSVPAFLAEARTIHEVLRTYSPSDLQSLMRINEKLSTDSFERIALMQFDQTGTSAVETYDGIQYKYMEPLSFSARTRAFAQEHLRIISGFYGVVRPYDSIFEYRLEMQTKLSVKGQKDLYAFWGDKLYEQLRKEMYTGSGVPDETPLIILNLASEEYGKCIRTHLTAHDHFITCLFQVYHKGSWKVQATAAKMARGQMVRYIMENRIDTPEGAAGFSSDGWEFEPDISTRNLFVFRKYDSQPAFLKQHYESLSIR